jgi:hypothetical protein
LALNTTDVLIKSPRGKYSVYSTAFEKAFRIIITVAVPKLIRIAVVIGAKLASDAVAFSGTALLSVTAP